MTVKGIVFEARSYIGSAAPPSTVLEDMSRFRNHGSHDGAGEPNAVQLPSGLWTWAYDQTDKITISPSPSINNLRAVTAEVWVNPTTLGGGNAGRLFHKSTNRDITNEGWMFALVATNRLIFLVKHATTTLARYGVNNIITLSKPNYVVVTWDGSTTATNVKLYINGAEVAYGTTTDGVGARPDDSAASLYMGNDPTNARGVNGMLTNRGLHNYVFSAEEISARFQKDKHWFGL